MFHDHHLHPETRKTKGVTAVVAASMIAAAIGAPGASARINIDPPDVSPTAAIAVPVYASPASSAFDWGDAGIGAAGTVALLGLSAGSAAAVRRTHGRRHAAIS